MDPVKNTSAWLESNDEGEERVPINGLCSFGRSVGNTVVLNTPKASRRHAMIHEQDGEFWIVDLGSTNGVSVDGQRVTHPVCLRDGNEVQMSSRSFVFHQVLKPITAAVKRRAPPLQQNLLTVPDIRLTKSWILVADLQGFTHLSQSVAPEKLAPFVGSWIRDCQAIIQGQRGVLAKFLGDGFLAYWNGLDESVGSVAKACRQFQALQQSDSPPFRVTVHYGIISFGGHSPDASHTMIGSELNFAFRLEKVASRLNLASIFSEAAATRLQEYLPLTSCGPQNIPDFESDRPCFTLDAVAPL